MSYTQPIRSRTTTSKSTMTNLKGKGKRTASHISEVNVLGESSMIPAVTQKKKKKIEIRSYGEDEEYAAGAANAALSGATDEKKQPPKKKAKKSESEEKRLRVFRKKAPRTYLERLERVQTQRMFLIDRERKLSADQKHEEEVFDIAGTTGNIYQVTISRQPTCTCPDNSQNGNQCKHIIYVLVNILKSPEDLAYQLAFLTTELAIIFSNAPVTPQSSDGSAEGISHPGSRKPIEGDCPVCVMEFEEQEDIVWCKAACGNNVHRQCFEQWAASKPGQVKCVYCRTPWTGDEESVKRISKMGKANDEGYVNVASELGIHGERDYSSYHQPWVRSQGYGRHGRY